MSGSVHQETKIGYNSTTRVTNTYPRKRGKIVNLPFNSTVIVKKSFKRKDLKERIARLRSSPEFRSGQIKAKNQLKTKRIKNISTS